MAKKKRIKNMTRAEHKQMLERAITLQNSAIRQVREKAILPKPSTGDDVYTQIVKAGQKVLEDDRKHSIKQERIKSYYSKKGIQQAMFDYAKGRKISVLKYFRPMFAGSQLRQPDDILPIMMFYSQESSLWPSMHGTVSYCDENGRPVCDLVIEVDCKKSRTRCFNLTRPLINLLMKLDIEFRVKYSGNASPHVIIPGEAFSEKWRKGGHCRHLFAELLNFFRKQIKDPNLLDRSFRNTSHFLRMLYSLNENTGLASIPIRVEDFDRFSWQDAYPEQVLVIADWWKIPDDASERTETLISFVLGEKRTIAMPSTEHSQSSENLKQFMPELISKNTKIGIITAGLETYERFNKISESMSIGEILSKENQDIQLLSQKHKIGKRDIMLMKNYSCKAEVLKYYSRQDIQNYIYSYCLGRCILLGNTNQYLILDSPSDIFPLAVYMVSEGISPEFQCTNAKYSIEKENMVSSDIVVRVSQTDIDLSNLNAPCFALYSGNSFLSIIFPDEVFKPEIELSQILNVTYIMRKYIKNRLKITGSLSIYSYDNISPIPYTIADNERVYLPLPLNNSNLSSFVTDISSVNTINDISYVCNNKDEFLGEIKMLLHEQG